MNFRSPPLSLYIHMPWCVKKCPYCDFNSHAHQGDLPETAYLKQLMLDLQTQLPFVQNRVIHSIFIGGGTPSLFSTEGYVALFYELRNRLMISSETEITLEANPGTIDRNKLDGFLNAGINRLSIGVQSFQEDKLQILGRIHTSEHAKNAVKIAQQTGFKRINIDLMFGLPNQTQDDALFDLQCAIHLAPTHLSWYQLTLEPNTYFHRFPPSLPSDDARCAIQEAGQQLLTTHHFVQYEISAYSKSDPCLHNLNYWLFGDYLGIGAGAHAKLTDLKSGAITRRISVKHPKQYLSANADTISTSNVVSHNDLPLEFMMNALRLFQPIPIELFEARTGLAFAAIEPKIQHAVDHAFMTVHNDYVSVTDKGHLFLNELLEVFLTG